MNLETFVVEVLVMNSFILLFAFILSPLWRKASGAARHMIWLIAFTAMIIHPCRLFVPAIKLETSNTAPAALTARPNLIRPKQAPPVLSSPPAGQVDNVSSVRNQTVISESSPVEETLFLLWLAGVTILLLRIAIQLARAYAWLKRCRAFADPTIQAALTKVSLPKRTPSIVTSEETDTAMTLGLLKPIIVLPKTANSWSEETIISVLRHECAHIERLDWPFLIFAKIMCAFHWFNPLVWFAAAKLKAESEVAADDAVLLAGSKPSTYASDLISLVTDAPNNLRLL